MAHYLIHRVGARYTEGTEDMTNATADEHGYIWFPIEKVPMGSEVDWNAAMVVEGSAGMWCFTVTSITNHKDGQTSLSGYKAPNGRMVGVYVG